MTTPARVVRAGCGTDGGLLYVCTGAIESPLAPRQSIVAIEIVNGVATWRTPGGACEESCALRPATPRARHEKYLECYANGAPTRIRLP